MLTETMTAAPSLSEKLDQLPDRPGAYLFKDVSGDVLYVGKAQSLRSRVRSYFQRSADLHPRTRQLVSQTRDLDFVVVDTELEALILEFNLIQKHQPRFNVRFRDSKSYPYLRVDLREDFPMLCVVRQHAVVRDGARYFGPYPSSQAMWETIRLVRRVFKVCQRSIVAAKRRSGCVWHPARGPRPRPCLDHFTGRCLGPCAGVVSQETYRQAVEQVCDFLEGKHEHMLKQLRAEMEAAATELRFEAAAALRDQIHALELTMSRQRIVSPGHRDADALGYALQEDTGCVAVIQVRDGRMVGQDHYLLAGVSGIAAAGVVNEFTKLHYQRAASVPRTVFVPVPIEDASAIADLLSDRRERKVTVLAPQRGDKRALVELAMQNAAQHLRTALEREGAEKRRGEEAIAGLQQALSLPVPPRRIEAFDISNVQGSQAVGSMVVFQDGNPKPSDYRRFKIRLSEGRPNDYEMMHEVLSRRLAAAVSGNVKFQHLPDLLLVDGGQGQLGVARRAMEALDLTVPVAGLAKEHEQVYLPARAAPILLPAHSRALHLLQRVRDEAHRFALGYHRALRERKVRESVLDDIPGIGKARKQRLLKHYHTLSRLRGASTEEIAAVAGCGQEVAQAVRAHLAQALRVHLTQADEG